MAHRFDYELLGTRSWTELRDLLYRADEGGWQAVGYSVVDGVHHVLMKRTPRQSVTENSGAAGAMGGEGPDS